MDGKWLQVFYASQHPDGNRVNGTLTGGPEHEHAVLPGRHIIAVWRMGTSDWCGKGQFDTEKCFAMGGYAVDSESNFVRIR